MYIANGGAVNVGSSATLYQGGSAGLVSIDVGYGSQLNVSGTLGSTLPIRIVCPTDASSGLAAGSTFTPITGVASITNPVTAVGGTWSANTFTASNIDVGTSGVQLTMPDQRALWTDSNGNTLGASFTAASNTPTVTALGSSVPAGLTLAADQFVVHGWQLAGLSTNASSSNPIYLSLSANNAIYNNYSLWAYNGTAWSQIVGPSAAAISATGSGTFTADTIAPDLAFDGTSYGFTLTGALIAGNSAGLTGGLNFNGYDYAVVGTPALAGDVNLDGRVDINDLTVVLGNYGQAGKTWTQGSIDGDPSGTVDINDLSIVLADYGNTVAASGGIGVSAVPEPSTLASLGVGAVGLLAYARRKRRPA